MGGTNITISGSFPNQTINASGIASATCTYTGSLVESGAINMTAGNSVAFGTADLGSNRVMSGIRTANNSGPYSVIYARGYNLRNN